MKPSSLAPFLFPLLLLAACGDDFSSPDYSKLPDAKEVRRHLEEAIDFRDLHRKHDREAGIWTYRNSGDKSLFTGWAKSTRGDGAAKVFFVKDGLEHGPRVTYYGDGTTMDSGWNVKGKRHGLYVFWNRTGKKTESRYEHGVKVEE